MTPTVAPVPASLLAPTDVVVGVPAQATGPALLALARLAGLAFLAAILAGLVALTYRWYVRERVPRGLSLLVALAGVAIVLNTTNLLAAELSPDGPSLEVVGALFNIAAFVGGAGGTTAGTRIGDALGTDLAASTGTADVDADVSQIVQSVGRVTTVQLPDEIDDVVGYDPVSPATKETLAGRRFLFPRRLTKGELRDRLVARLKRDYGVGHVDLELADDGSVAYAAVGSRAAGIGPTLPPATNAVAIRADPAHAASAGDLVQVWETDPLQRVLTGELRGVAGDVVTVAIDAADTPKLDPTRRYKLVTLPVEDRPDREFAALLRAADETLATVTVEPGSDLAGGTVGSLGVTVAAITRDDAEPDPLPAADRTLRAGDCVYAIARPESLRTLEAAAKAPADRPANEPDSSGADRPDEDGDAGADGVSAAGEPVDDPWQDDGTAQGSDEPSAARGEAEPRTADDARDVERQDGDPEADGDPAEVADPPVDDASTASGEDADGDGDDRLASLDGEDPLADPVDGSGGALDGRGDADAADDAATANGHDGSPDHPRDGDGAEEALEWGPSDGDGDTGDGRSPDDEADDHSPGDEATDGDLPDDEATDGDPRDDADRST